MNKALAAVEDANPNTLQDVLKGVNFNRRIGQRTLDDSTLVEFIQHFTEIPLEEVRRVMDIGRHPVSLDRPVGEGEDSSFGEFIEDSDSHNPVRMAASSIFCSSRLTSGRLRTACGMLCAGCSLFRASPAWASRPIRRKLRRCPRLLRRPYLNLSSSSP